MSAAPDPLVPRDLLFGNPDRFMPRVSPDGRNLAWIAPHEGVLNVWVAPIGALAAARPITHDRVRSIREFHWATSGEHVLHLQDTGGDEDWHVHSTEIATGRSIDLTPAKKAAAQLLEVSPRHPHEILVGLNDRDPRLHNVLRIDVRTGATTRLLENPGYVGFVTDDDFAIRFALEMTPEGGSRMLRREADGSFAPFADIPADIPADDVLTTSPIGIDAAGTTLYMFESRGRDTSAAVAIDLATGATRLLAEHSRADAVGVLRHPLTGVVEAVAFDPGRRLWQVLDPAVARDFDVLVQMDRGDVAIVSRTLADDVWVIAYLVDDGPVRYHLYDRAAQRGRFLFTNRRELEGVALARMHPVEIRSRDGLPLVGYLSLPRWTDPAATGRPAAPLPMVLLVHGGPWARDVWGVHPHHQWLANRGYAVLSVNYRGSTGFGKGFLNAANFEWGGRMHDDLLDAVEWAVDQGVAQRDRIAIMGGSYGGYATLVGLTLTPDVFACGVDIVGPSSIVTLIESVPPYWEPMLSVFTRRVGDHRTEEGRAFLVSRSPLSRVDAIRRPLLIGQGANDPRVKQAESDQIVRAMQQHGIPVTYVLFPDEGHGFARPQNSRSFFAVAEAFLARQLGGRFEPVGDDFDGSSIQIPAGAELVPGLP